ncbi:hypothetical protein, partial [Xenorhabdus bovienii]|uniref:hypothetical protein n=1 Tax=Xenorhabdus bovienii TaxID=40576 RepID=UPI003DA1FEED
MPINPLDPFRTEDPLVKSKLIVAMPNSDSAIYINSLIHRGFLKQDNPINPTTLVVEANSIEQLCYRPIVNCSNIREMLDLLGFTQVTLSCSGVRFVLNGYPGIRTLDSYKRRVLGSWSMY